MIGFGGTSRIDSFSCTIADESLIALALRVVRGQADIWASRVTVLYHRTESSPQRNVPGDAIVGSSGSVEHRRLPAPSESVES